LFQTIEYLYFPLNVVHLTRVILNYVHQTTKSATTFEHLSLVSQLVLQSERHIIIIEKLNNFVIL